MSFKSAYSNFNSKRLLSKYSQGAKEVESLKSKSQALTDEELKKEFLLLNTSNIASKLYWGFALVREACKRTTGLFPHTVQVIGGLCLYDGKLAEMRTGEGKTLTIVAPAALLSQVHKKPVHVVTANSYLAQRDADLMKPIYEFLGLTCAAIYESQSIEEKKNVYASNVVYGVGHEFGFDYLKDNLATDLSQVVQSELFAAIVDEVDSILIDEAKTPMIISSQAQDISYEMSALSAIVEKTVPGEHFTVNIQKNEAAFTEKGYDYIESLLVRDGLTKSAKELYTPAKLYYLTLLNNLLRAHVFLRKGRDYIIENNEILLVDIGTGRKMYGRRLQDGLHEALEAKEKVFINRGNLAKASITYQNFFNMYQRLAGLSGTALTDADEFSEVYGLITCEIPPNKPVARIVNPDLMYQTRMDKFNAAIAIVLDKIKNNPNQPILLGTGSVRDAMVLDSLLTHKGIEHNLLTAANIEKEAHIIANAGKPGAITLATNMAGRGTDIILGGEKPASEDDLKSWEQDKEKVKNAGGLFVLVTERNVLRRVDNQFAGRSARQGDPGEVQFLLSLEDDLFTQFSSSKLMQFSQKVDISGGVGGKLVNKFIVAAQVKAEEQGAASRKELTKLDSVLIGQRDVIFGLRKNLLKIKAEQSNFSLTPLIEESIPSWVQSKVDDPFQIDFVTLKKEFSNDFSIEAPFLKWSLMDDIDDKKLISELTSFMKKYFEEKQEILKEKDIHVETLMLQILDEGWTHHLTNLDELRTALNLKQHSNLNPVFQFHKDAFDMFNSFLKFLNINVLSEVGHLIKQASAGEKTIYRKAITPDQLYALEAEKRWIHRNENCPCNSGKKFKLCHGRLK